MLSLAGSAGLATAGPAQPAAVDEAAVLARIHALQAQPDAAQADWLRGWLDYRSRARRLASARLLPRQPRRRVRCEERRDAHGGGAAHRRRVERSAR